LMLCCIFLCEKAKKRRKDDADEGVVKHNHSFVFRVCKIYLF
jgi:hypothetical protein